MPYSDDLYSSLDDEWDVETVGAASTQHGNQAPDVPRQDAWLDTNTTNAHADYGAVSSGDAVDVEDPHVFSPTDGYFGSGTGTSSGTVVPASSNVPHVPNVLVEDPSLQRSAAESKAREAEEERRRNNQGVRSSEDGHTSTYPFHTPAASRNGSTSAYAISPTQQSSAVGSRSGAAYYAPSSSSYMSPAVTPTSYTNYSTRRSAYHGERFPFLPTEAPPAYTPSPASPTNTHGFGGPARNYQTFTHVTDTNHSTVNMGRPEETQGLLAHQPESMRDHNDPDGPGELSPTWRERVRRVRQHVNWGSCKVVLVALLLCMVAVGFISSLVSGARGRTGHHNPAVDEPQTAPGQPDMSYPDVDGGFDWNPSQFCKDAQIPRHIQTYDVDFGANKQLIILEKTSDDDGRRGWGEVHVQGAVIVRRAGKNTPHSAVTLEVTFTDERLKVYLSWDSEAGALQVIVPHRVDWSPDRPRACINVKIIVWVPEDGQLNRLHIDAVHLDIKLLDNLSLTIGEGSKLTSTVGTITSASTGNTTRDEHLLDDAPTPPPTYNFNSRIIDVRTTAAPITGIWPLFDYLGLQSTAGSIKVAITPKSADPKTPRPAILDVQSLSGDVTFREPIHQASAAATFRIAQSLPSSSTDLVRSGEGKEAEALIPPREYRVNAHTTSGDITGAVAFSSSAGFKSTSGAIRVEVLPVLDVSWAKGVGAGAREAELVTASTSGATDVRVLEALWVGEDSEGDLGMSGEAGSETWQRRYVALKGGKATAGGGDGGRDEYPLRCLSTNHTSTSADIKVRLPGSWEGDISLSTLTGALEVDGDGVKLIKAGSDWPGIKKMLLARKGEKGVGGKVAGKSTSGKLGVFVGLD